MSRHSFRFDKSFVRLCCLTLGLLVAAVPLCYRPAAFGARAAATITVNTTADDNTVNGNCTLREAILAANTDAAVDACTAGSGTDTIAFAIPGAGPHTIAPTSPLPQITAPVIIDGTTQPGASCTTAGGLKIELNGTGAGIGAGLSITAGNSTVKGLVINRFPSNGVALVTGGGNTVSCNYIGTDVAGTTDLGNAQNGIYIINTGSTSAPFVHPFFVQNDGDSYLSGAVNNTIGGTAAGAGNLISGNNANGIQVEGNAATGNQVQGNLIGTNAAGTAALGNSSSGIAVVNAPNNTIGGTVAGARNLISGNLNNGVICSGTAATGNTVSGNYIGVDVTGTADLGNAAGGVRTSDAPGNTIGGTAAGAGNVISGNNVEGVRLAGAAGGGNVVQGNFIGTNAAGTAAILNTREGIFIERAPNNLIGGTTAGARNVISGNGQPGVLISFIESTNNRVQGNYIGTNAAGTAAIGNLREGVTISQSAANNQVGGTTAGAGNVISGNGGNGGITITNGANNNRIEGNYIGTDVNGTADLGNTQQGVGVTAPNNVIGGTAAGAGNLISGNDSTGVFISGAGAAGNRVEGNFIGTDAGGTVKLGNTFSGVQLSAPNNIVGGTTPGARNIISGNSGGGVSINNSGGGNPTGNRVEGNYIGTDLTGTANLGNRFAGVIVVSFSGNTTNSTIGGTTPGAGNLIAFNRSGIEITPISVNTSVGHAVLGNSIISNHPQSGTAGGLGIDLTSPSGVTANDAGDGDAGANNRQNFPVLTLSGLAGVINGSLDSTAANSAYPVRLEFFLNTVCDASGNGEGEVFVGAMALNAPGNFTFNYTPILGKSYITATATDANGNTSEFSPCQYSCMPMTISPATLSSGTASAAYGQSLSVAGAFGNAAVFSLLSGALPAGLTLSPAGVITGTPTQTGVFNFVVQASDSFTCTSTQACTLTVNCNTLIVNPAGLPDGQGGVAYNQSFAAAGANGAVTYSLLSGTPPPGLTLNPNGTLTGTPTQVGSFTFTIKATDGNGCTGMQQYTVNIVFPATTIAPPTGGPAGTNYNQMLSVSPPGNYTFALTGGNLPPGLTLSPSGVLSGMPTQAGTFTFMVTATGFGGGPSVPMSVTVTINCPTVTVNPTTLPTASAGAAYNQTVSATPGGTTYNFTVTSGALPPGVTLNATTGVLSGTPTTAGNYGFTITATGFNGTCPGTRNYTLQVTSCTTTVTVNPATLPGGTVGAAYPATTITASPAGTYTFAVSGSLPPGLTLDASTGGISGTPTQSGLFSFTITATSAGGCRGSRSYSRVSIACPTATFTPAGPALPNAQVGANYNQTISVTPVGAYTFTVIQGNLPPGMTLNPTTGALTGAPTAVGNYSFTIRAAVGNCQPAQAYTLTVGAAAALAVVGDFDGDRKTDLGVWRGLQSDWLVINSATNQLSVTPWGAQYAPFNDVLAPGDYDGDGKVDWAVYRRGEGRFYVKCSRDGAVMTQSLGTGADTPVPGDYDGDRKTDFAVWRAATGQWLIKRSGDGTTQTQVWGAGNAPYLDVPVHGDYDGDGRTDLAFFRQSNGHWYVKRSSDGGLLDRHWGVAGDIPVPGDYDGDGKCDVAVWRGGDTNWYVVRSSDSAVVTTAWGSTAMGDVPVPGDYDGDGKTDIAVWRAPEGRWYIIKSSTGTQQMQRHGQAGDTPVPARMQP